jgi:hypothetical protein
MTTAVALTCLHDRGAQCWLCGDLVHWWREARLRAGLPAEPPNAPRYRPAPKEAVKVSWDDVYDYWESHPNITLGQAQRTLQKQRR